MRKKVILGVVGAILLGGLGSGLWDLVLKPILIWISSPMLDIATLGLTGLRDDMYAGVAKGEYDRPGLGLLGALVGTVLAGVSGFLLFEVRGMSTGQSSSPVAGRFTRWVGGKWTASTAMMVVTLAFAVVSFRIAYEEDASTYAAQLQRIVAPYVTPEERLVFDSRLAQVATRADFVAVITEMRDIAAKNSATVPDFDIY